MKKDIFIDEYERSNIIEDRQKFLKIVKDLKSYLFQFNKDRSIKARDYSYNYIVESNIR